MFLFGLIRSILLFTGSYSQDAFLEPLSSEEELECINKKGIKECIVPSNHFSESGNYYTYYNNSLGHKIVLYEISTININLESK